MLLTCINFMFSNFRWKKIASENGSGRVAALIDHFYPFSFCFCEYSLFIYNVFNDIFYVDICYQKY